MKLFISLILAFSIQSLPALAQSDCPKILALLNQGSPILPPNRLLAKNLAPQFQETFQKLLKEIDSAPNLPNPADHYLIRSMMEQGKLFAAAKMLRVNGKQEIAEKIIDFTEQLLLHDRVIHFENMKDITRSEEFIKENLYKVKLESGIEAVMKVDRADWRQQSLMVSQLEDQHTKIEPAVSDISRVIAKGLGQDLVPPTVQRSHVEGFPTRRKVSLQYFESDAAANEAEKIGPQQQRILDAFDSLIMNNDRHDGNFLAFKINSAEDHHAIAIDNAAALKNFPGTRFYLKLHELDYQQARFFEAIENHLTEEKIREILIKHELPQFTRSLSQSRRALLENYRAWSALKNQGHGIASAASAIQSFLIANEELVSKMKIEGEALLNMARKVGMGANREEARKEAKYRATAQTIHSIAQGILKSAALGTPSEMEKVRLLKAELAKFQFPNARGKPIPISLTDQQWARVAEAQRVSPLPLFGENTPEKILNHMNLLKKDGTFTDSQIRAASAAGILSVHADVSRSLQFADKIPQNRFLRNLASNLAAGKNLEPSLQNLLRRLKKPDLFSSVMECF